MATRDSVSSSAGVVNESVVFIVVIKLLRRTLQYRRRRGRNARGVGRCSRRGFSDTFSFYRQFRSIGSPSTCPKKLDRKKRIVRLRREPLMSGHAQDD